MGELAAQDAGASAERRIEVALPRDRQAPSIARRRVLSALRGRIADADLASVMLIVSELVTNAVVHGEGAIALRLGQTGRRVVGEVVDEGVGFEHELREHGTDDLNGRGLMLVASLVDRWGVHEGTTHVWFEFTAGIADARPAAPRLGEEEAPAEP